MGLVIFHFLFTELQTKHLSFSTFLSLVEINKIKGRKGSKDKTDKKRIQREVDVG